MADLKKDPGLKKQVDRICKQFTVCSTCPLNALIRDKYRCAAHYLENDKVWQKVKKYHEQQARKK